MITTGITLGIVARTQAGGHPRAAWDSDARGGRAPVLRVVLASRLATQKLNVGFVSERAVSDPRAAEILLRWLQRPRTETTTPGVDLDALSIEQLESLHAGLTRLATLPANELRVLVASLRAAEEDG